MPGLVAFASWLQETTRTRVIFLIPSQPLYPTPKTTKNNNNNKNPCRSPEELRKVRYGRIDRTELDSLKKKEIMSRVWACRADGH